jgi:hypothetical protein
MGGPRFRPSSAFQRSRDFGRNSVAQPVSTPHLSAGERSWALFQHDVACSVRSSISRSGLGVADFAEMLGENTEWLTRKINGRVPADLAEMLDWLSATGAEVPMLRIGGAMAQW